MDWFCKYVHSSLNIDINRLTVDFHSDSRGKILFWSLSYKKWFEFAFENPVLHNLLLPARFQFNKSFSGSCAHFGCVNTEIYWVDQVEM